MLIAGIVAPWLAGRAATTQEEIARQHHSERDISAMIALEHAPELRVAGMLPDVIAESRRRANMLGDNALDAAARPAALAEAVPTAAIGGQCARRGGGRYRPGARWSRPPHRLVLMLLPLSAFEAMTALPAAAVQLGAVADLSGSPARPGSASRHDQIVDGIGTPYRHRSVIR